MPSKLGTISAIIAQKIADLRQRGYPSTENLRPSLDEFGISEDLEVV